MSANLVRAGERRFQRYPSYRRLDEDWLEAVPSHWKYKPLWTLYRRVKRVGHPDEELLSVYRDYGVIPKASREDNFNRPSEDLSTYQLVKPRDLVTNKMKAWQGSIAISTVRGIVSPAYHVYEASHSHEEKFLHYLLRSPQYIAGYMKRSKGVRVNQWDLEPEAFSRMSVVLPPHAEQCVIADFLDHETAKIDRLIEEKERLLELLEEKRTALISRVVTKGLNPDVEMKDSGVEWLGEIPAHWRVSRLQHLTQRGRPIMYGIVLPGPDVPEGVPIVKGGDVKPGRLRLEKLSRTTFEIESRYVRSRLRGGDLVYAIRGSIGEVEKVPEELTGANLTQDAARISVHGEISTDWLFFALRSRSLFAQLEAGALGATIRGINIRDLKRGVLAVPPRSEQEVIAASLDEATWAIDNLVEEVMGGIDLAREYRTALISAAVTGRIDVREYAA